MRVSKRDKVIGYVGKVFGDVLVTGYEETDYRDFNLNVVCQVCGREKTISHRNFFNGTSTNHKQCMYLVPRDDHFHSKFKGMIKRATNPKYENYHRYGGRGIKCMYTLFIDFYDDMYESYLEFVSENGKSNTTLDRIDTNGHYEFDNLRWATPKTQANNRRNNWINIQAISPDGEVFEDIDVTDFSEENGLIRVSIYQCLNGLIKKHKGWRFTADK